MHEQSNGNGQVTYLITIERRVQRTEAAEIAVIVDGPTSPESLAEALRRANEERGAGKALAWASVGEPVVIGPETVLVGAVA